MNPRMIQPHLMSMNNAPGGPGHGQPFPGRATTGPGPAGVRSISPGAFSSNARSPSTTMGTTAGLATAAATFQSASATTTTKGTPLTSTTSRGIQPRPMGTTPQQLQQSGKTLITHQAPIQSFKVRVFD